MKIVRSESTVLPIEIDTISSATGTTQTLTIKQVWLE